MENHNFLTVYDIHKSFGSGDNRAEVLKGIHFSAAKGENLCFAGTVRIREINIVEYYRWD